MIIDLFLWLHFELENSFQLIAMIYLYITSHCICPCCKCNRLPRVSNFNAPINVMPYSPTQAYVGITLPTSADLIVVVICNFCCNQMKSMFA